MKKNLRKELIEAGFVFQNDEKFGEVMVKDRVMIPVMAVEGMSVEQLLDMVKSVEEEEENALGLSEDKIRESIKESTKLINKLDCSHYISVYLEGNDSNCRVNSQLLKVPYTIADKDTAIEALYGSCFYANKDAIELIRMTVYDKKLIIRSWPTFADIYKQPFGCAYIRLLYEAYSKFDYDAIVLTVRDDESNSVVGISAYQRGMISLGDMIGGICQKVEEIASRVNTKRIHCIGINGDTGNLVVSTIERTKATLIQDLLANKPIDENVLLVSKQDNGDYYVISDLSVGLTCTESEIERLKRICTPLKDKLGFDNKVVVINTNLNHDFYDEIDLYK